MEKDKINFRKFFWFHGVELQRCGTELLGDCPFCSKEQHFYVSPRDGRWDCKSCGESGNAFTFLTNLHAASLSSPERLQPLAEDRGIQAEFLAALGLSVSPLTDAYLLPVRNEKGSVVNLYVSRPERNGDGYKFPVYSSPAPCQQHLYLKDYLQGCQELHICEGHWDALAWKETLAHLQYRQERVIEKGTFNLEKSLATEVDVVGAPGATTFPEEWLPLLKGKDVVLLYDNDEPGLKGMRKLAYKIQQSSISPHSLRQITWSSDDPNDIRDLIRRKGYLSAYRHVLDSLQEVNLEEPLEDEEETITPVECPTFEELLGHYKTYLLLNPDTEATLAVMLAAILSQPMGGNQIGLRVIGPPGSAKSTLAEAMSYCKDLVYPTSKFTGLISGFGTLKKTQQLAAKINGHCLLIKDADMMLQLPNWKQVESELRDALGDGVIRAEYRNGKSENIITNFSVVLCGTKTLRKMDDSQLGSRFLDVIIFDPRKEESNPDQIVDVAIKTLFSELYQLLAGREDNNTITSKLNIQVLAPVTTGFLLGRKALLESRPIPEFNEQRSQQIQAMGALIAWCRSKVDRGIGNDLSYRPEKELHTRVSQQLFKLAYVLAIIYSSRNKITITRKVVQTLQKVCRDTCDGFTFEILEALYQHPEGLTAEQLSWKLRLSLTQTRKLLNDLHELEMLTKKPITNIHGAGRASHFLYLQEKVRQAFKLAFTKA